MDLATPVAVAAGVAALAYLLGALTRVIAVALALRGTRPNQRPEILRALGDCFRAWPVRRS